MQHPSPYLLAALVLALFGTLTPLPAQVGLNQGPFVRMVRHNDGSRTVTARDEQTKVQEIKTYDSEGELKLRRLYQLNRYGKPESFMIYDGNGTPQVRGEFVYDASDRMREEKLFSLPDGRPLRDLKQEYDASGRALPPRVTQHGAMPASLLYWMDPDSAAAASAGGTSSARPREGGSDEDKRRLLPNLFKNRKN